MISFQPDQVSFGDGAGYGDWDTGHAREHITFVQAFAGRTPPVLLADYPLLAFLTGGPARKSVLESHAKVHTLIRPLVGISGIDLSGVDLDNEGQFYDWLGRHAEEHRQIRQFLGMT